MVGFDEISWLRGNSPAWRLLRAENAPLVLSFPGQVFVSSRQLDAGRLRGRGLRAAVPASPPSC